MIARVETLSHDGRGIARIDGKATFIQNALPGETVAFRYLRKKKDFDEGQVLSVIDPSVHRVEPLCPHYSVCGGCSLQHLNGATQLYEKQKQLLELFARMSKTQPENVLEPLMSSLWHYRNKARLSVRYSEKKQTTLLGFREKNNPREIADITQCLILNERVSSELGPLRQMLNALDAPQNIAQIEVAVGDHEVALILRNLFPLSLQDEEKVKEFARSNGFRIFLQPGGAESVFLFYPEDGQSLLTYPLLQDDIIVQFHPTDFTQVNAGMNQLMVAEALKLLALKPKDRVLDLFCGLGNFSLPIARYCAQVIGVEGSDAMVLRARMNAEANGLTNAQFLCENLDGDSVLSGLSQYKPNKMLLDPPRTGALNIVKTVDQMNLERIVYVSCHPATLARDTNVLVHQQGFRLLSAGVMDMFPHTAHVESVAVFERR
jgi:23S rRNA (uracil1939-C5)-methyltransferase